MRFGDRAVELVFCGAETSLKVRPVLGDQILRVLQLFSLVVQLRLQLLVALVHRRAVLASSLFLRRSLFGCLCRCLLRCRHVIQFGGNGAELALQLVDRGVGHGLLRAEVPNRNLLAIAVAKRESGHDQQRHAADQNPAVDACQSWSPGGSVLSFLILVILFHSSSSSMSWLFAPQGRVSALALSRWSRTLLCDLRFHTRAHKNFCKRMAQGWKS